MEQKESHTLQSALLHQRHRFSSQIDSDVIPEDKRAAVLHPLYSVNGLPPKSEFHSTINHIRARIKSFADDLTKYDQNVQTLPRRDEKEKSSTSLDVSQIPNNKKQKVVSLLREQSSHVATIGDIVDIVEQNGQVKSKSVLPLSLFICSLSALGGRSWPTDDEVEAFNGLKAFVNALESLATIDLGLEAFAEEHISGTGIKEDISSTLFTLTLAAKIIVCDVELGLRRNQDHSWSADIRVRISYATDSASSSQGPPNQLRDGRLGDMLRRHIQDIANILFGQSKQVGDPVIAAGMLLGRLRSNFQILHHLDDLSSDLSLDKYPDLFALMSELSKTLSENTSKEMGKHGEISYGRVLEYEENPYASIEYYPLSSRSSARSLPDRHVKRFMLYINVERSLDKHNYMTETNSQLPSLATKEHQHTVANHLQYMAILDPPLVLPSSVARLLKNHVMPDAAGRHKQSTSRIVNGYDKLLSIAHGKNNQEQENTEHHVQVVLEQRQRANSEYSVLVDRFEFTALEELQKRIQLLRQHAHFNHLLCGVIKAKKGEHDSYREMSHVQLEVEINESANISLVASLGRGHSIAKMTLTEQNSWTVSVYLEGNQANILQPEIQSELSQMLSREDEDSVVAVITRLQEWNENGSSGHASFNSNEQIGTTGKRRRSSSASNPQ